MFLGVDCMWRVLVVLGVVSTGCVTPSGASSSLGAVRRDFLTFTPGSTEAPTRWRVVEADAFTLISDLPVEQLKEAAQAIAQSYAGIKAMFGKLPEAIDAPPTIVALADDMEFQKVFGSKVNGITMSNEKGSWIFVYGAPYRWFDRPVLTQNLKTSVLQHELAHAVLRSYFAVQPRWFAEGMAQYLETNQWLDAQTVSLGEPNLEAYSAYRGIRSVGVADLQTWGFIGEQELRDLTSAGLYGESWAFVHWAITNEPDRFVQYMYLLTKGDVNAAWKQTFGPIQPSIDTAVFQYMKNGQHSLAAVKVPAAPAQTVTIAAVSEKSAQRLEAMLEQLEKKPR